MKKKITLRQGARVLMKNWTEYRLGTMPHFDLCAAGLLRGFGFYFAGTFDTSSLASTKRASSSARLTVSTSSLARISLAIRCQCVRSSRFCQCWSCTRPHDRSCAACRHPWSAADGLGFGKGTQDATTLTYKLARGLAESSSLKRVALGFASAGIILCG
jgi:hypothetical protein